jgi:hypothetical protein
MPLDVDANDANLKLCDGISIALGMIANEAFPLGFGIDPTEKVQLVGYFADFLDQLGTPGYSRF